MDYAVYEKSSRAGGLLDNFQIDGYRFDHAVHLSFATEKKVRKIFDRRDYFTHQAASSNYDGGTWLKHPAQNNLFPLPPSEKVDLVRSLIERPAYAQPENYEQWLLHQFGLEIASRFLCVTPVNIGRRKQANYPRAGLVIELGGQVLMKYF